VSPPAEPVAYLNELPRAIALIRKERMKAIPQPKTTDIVERINVLQAASPYYINSSDVTPLVREWRAIGREIEPLFKVDAYAAWEMKGAWQSLAGDHAGTEAAFKNSVALSNSGSNHENWLVNRLNLGRFSAAHPLYAGLGSPEDGHFSLPLTDGYITGAVGQAACFIGKAKKMHIERDEAQVCGVTRADEILRDAGISDQHMHGNLMPLVRYCAATSGRRYCHA
jgi:hypothetical protein